MTDVRAAEKTLEGVIRRTPIDKSRTFSEMTSGEIYLKLENLQKTGSFKTRGAYNKISSLSDSERRRGVVAASAGNHAQGVAFSASLLKTRATIIMPEHASPAKVDATKGYGAEVVLKGKSFDDALVAAKDVSTREGLTLIHAFDDPKVIAGQGTIGLEMLQSEPDLQLLVVPVGGGGLISGIALAAKSTNPRIRVVGVQSRAYHAAYSWFQKGRIPQFSPGDTLADGIAVKTPGEMTMGMIRQYVDDIVLVDDNAIAKAMLLLLERAKVVVEPAGAAGLAAVLSGEVRAKNKKCGVVISGGNVDMYTLDQIVAKGLEMEKRLLRLRFALEDRPGSLREIIDAVAEAHANVVDVHHERMGSQVSLGRADVVLSLETQNEEHTRKLLSVLRSAGITYKVLG